MRYYKQEENGVLRSIGVGAGATEITREEYDSLLSEIMAKADLVNRLYSGEITIDDVPQLWQEEIQRRVDERIAAEEAAAEQDISAQEALDIILGGETA